MEGFLGANSHYRRQRIQRIGQGLDITQGNIFQALISWRETGIYSFYTAGNLLLCGNRDDVN